MTTTLRVAFANIDFVHSNKSIIPDLCADHDVVIVVEAKDTVLAERVPEGWTAFQTTGGTLANGKPADAARAGCGILLRDAAVTGSGWQVTYSSGPVPGGMMRRYTGSLVAVSPDGGEALIVASHWPPYRFHQPLHERSVKKVLSRRRAVLLGADVNQNPEKAADTLDLDAYGAEVVGLFASGVTVVRSSTFRHPGSDHPVVSAVISLPKKEAPVAQKIEAPSPVYLGPPRNHGGAGNKPIGRVVVHCTAGSEPGVEGAARGTARYFQTTPRKASAHYVADAKESVQALYDSFVGYHAPPNDGSIGYEICCSLNDEGKGHWQRPDHLAALAIAAKDIARLCLAYDVPIVQLTPADLRAGKKGICGHIDVSNAFGQTSHWDPGPYFPWTAFIAQIKTEALLLTRPERKPTRGKNIDAAEASLERAVKANASRPKRLARVQALLEQLRNAFKIR